MQNLLCSPRVSSLLIKKQTKNKQRGCLSGVQDDKRCENRYNVLCKDKKSLELKPAASYQNVSARFDS